MGQTPDQLREEIETARNDLGETLGAIGDKVSPKRIAQRRVGRARQGMTQLRERVMGTAEGAYDSTSTKVGDTGRSIAGAGQSAGSAIASAGQSVGSAAAEASSTLAEKGRQAPEMVTEKTQGNPIGVGLIAFGLGAVAASLLPETKMETQQADTLKRNVVEPVTEQAKEAGKQVAQDLKESAMASKDAVTEKATEAVQQVQEAGKESVVNLREEAKGSAENVKSTAQESAETVKARAQSSSGSPSSAT